MKQAKQKQKELYENEIKEKMNLVIIKRYKKDYTTPQK